MAASFREKTVFKKLNRIVLRVVAPVLGAALVVYACFSPAVFQLDEDYYFTAAGIRVSGGKTVVGPGEVRLWGRYPWVYGTVDGKGFSVNLKTNDVEHFETEERYRRFLTEEQLNPALCRTWKELYADDAEDVRQSLKALLSRGR